MATVYYNLDPNVPLTPEQEAEIEALKDRPIVYDEDCPPITPEMIKKAYRPGRDRLGDMVSMRIQISPNTLEMAKTWGKNYVAILGELLDKAALDYAGNHKNADSKKP